MLSSTPNVRAITVQPQDEPPIRAALSAAITRTRTAMTGAEDAERAALSAEVTALTSLLFAFGG